MTLLNIQTIGDVEKSNATKFKSIYWLDKYTFIKIYYDLEVFIKSKTNLDEQEDNQLNEFEIKYYKQISSNLLLKFLMFFNYIKNYSTNQQFSATWGKDIKTITKYRRHMIELFLFYFEVNPIDQNNRYIQTPLNIKLTDQTLNGDVVTKSTDVYCVVGTSFFQISKMMGHSKEKEYYSGKHKKHGVKVQTVVNISNGKLCYISRNVYKGAMHDIEIARVSGLCNPAIFTLKPNERILGDLGYLGEDKVFISSNIRSDGQNGENLSQMEQKLCSFLSSHRIIVENLYGRVKSALQILSNKYRGDLSEYEDIVFIIFNLFNIILDFSPLRRDIQIQKDITLNQNTQLNQKSI